MWLLGTGLCFARDSTLLYNLTLSRRFSWHFSWHFAWHLLDTFLDALQNRMRMRKYCAGIAGCRFARTVLLISRRACHHTPPMICDRLWPKYNRRRALPCSMKPHGQGGLITFIAIAYCFGALLKDLLLHLHMHLMLREKLFCRTCPCPCCYVIRYSLALAHTLDAALWYLLLHLPCTCCYLIRSSRALVPWMLREKTFSRAATLYGILLHLRIPLMLHYDIPFFCTCTCTCCYLTRSPFDRLKPQTFANPTLRGCISRHGHVSDVVFHAPGNGGLSPQQPAWAPWPYAEAGAWLLQHQLWEFHRQGGSGSQEDQLWRYQGIDRLLDERGWIS